MMYCKSVFFSDQASAEKIMGSEDPGTSEEDGTTGERILG